MEMKICTGIGSLGPYVERYVPDGYCDVLEYEKKVKILSGIDGITGINISYPDYPYINNTDKLKTIFKDNNLDVALTAADYWTNEKWRYGSLSSSDSKVRKEAIDIAKHVIDLTVEFNADSVLIWLAHDGSDYAFQVDFENAWVNMIESLNEIGQYNPDIKIAIEYKQKDPRAKSYIEDFGKTMFLIKSLDVDNVGVALDLGHSFFAGERPAETLTLCNSQKKLYQIHLNDNYRDADPDLLLGTINFWDTLEFFYWLQKIDYKGWLNIDVICPRNNNIKMLELAVSLISDYKALSDKLGESSDKINSNLINYNFAENMDIIRKIVFEQNT